MKKGDSGEQVYAMQVALVSLGYSLPRWGADRHWGAETDAALKGFAVDHGVPYEDAPKKVSDVLVATSRALPACVVDMRGTSKTRTGGRRKWKAITGITLHQTAAAAAVKTAAQVTAARAWAARINTHMTVLRNGDAVWGQDFDTTVWHAQNVFNARDIGLDIDGHYAGVEGNLSTYWRPKDQPNRQPLTLLDVQVESALEAIDFIIAEVARHGGKIRYIHAHRQTANDRTSDPGSAIWQRIAIPAMAKHGLSYGGPGFFVPLQRDAVEFGVFTSDGPGWPIPVEWDPSATHSYRHRPPKPTKQES